MGNQLNAACCTQGRASIEMKIKLKEVRQDGIAGGMLRIVADGYNAPLTAGNFVDLVKRGFYNGMEIQRSDGFVVQTGDPGPPVRHTAGKVYLDRKIRDAQCHRSVVRPRDPDLRWSERHARFVYSRWNCVVSELRQVHPTTVGALLNILQMPRCLRSHK